MEMAREAVFPAQYYRKSILLQTFRFIRDTLNCMVIPKGTGSEVNPINRSSTFYFYGSSIGQFQVQCDPFPSLNIFLGDPNFLQHDYFRNPEKRYTRKEPTQNREHTYRTATQTIEQQSNPSHCRKKSVTLLQILDLPSWQHCIPFI